MTKKLVVLLLILTVAAFSAGTSYALEGWGVMTFKHAINDTTGIALNYETHTNDAWIYAYEHIDLGISYQANDWLNIGANYRVEQQNWKAFSNVPIRAAFRVVGNRGYVSVPFIRATIMGKASGVELYNHFILALHTGADLLFWWNISGANFPVKFNNGSTLVPYVQLQPMIGINKWGLFDIRTVLGVDYKFADSKWIVPGIFYVNEFRNMNTRFGTNNDAIALNLTFNVQ